MSRKERWKWCVGYEHLYEVSDQGRVRSVDRVVRVRVGGVRSLKGMVLVLVPSGKLGRLRVRLSAEGVKRTEWVHQLAALAWIGPRPDGQEVRHGAKGITDNSIGNICYGTRSQNHLDKRRDGTHGGKAVRRSDGVGFVNMHVAAEETGCLPQHIWRVCNGRRKTTRGFGFEYV